MIKPEPINFFIVWAFIIIGRLFAQVLAALLHDKPIGQAISLIAA
jgi:hypothetical protein